MDRHALASEDKILGVDLPMKSGETIFDPCVDFIVSCRERFSVGQGFKIWHSRLSSTPSTVPPCQCLRAERNSEHRCTWANCLAWSDQPRLAQPRVGGPGGQRLPASREDLRQPACGSRSDRGGGATTW